MKNLDQQTKETARAFSQSLDRFAQQYGLTGTQMSIIDFLGKSPQHACDRKVIEHEFAIRRSTATQIIQRMVYKGLVKQAPSPVDGRQKIIILTDKGSQLAPMINNFMARKEQVLATVIDVPKYRQMLIKIKEVLQNE